MATLEKQILLREMKDLIDDINNEAGVLCAK